MDTSVSPQQPHASNWQAMAKVVSVAMSAQTILLKRRARKLGAVGCGNNGAYGSGKGNQDAAL